MIPTVIIAALLSLASATGLERQLYGCPDNSCRSAVEDPTLSLERPGRATRDCQSFMTTTVHIDPTFVTAVEEDPTYVTITGCSTDATPFPLPSIVPGTTTDRETTHGPVPHYASACAASSDYAVACGCLGVFRSRVTSTSAIVIVLETETITRHALGPCSTELPSETVSGTSTLDTSQVAEPTFSFPETTSTITMSFESVTSTTVVTFTSELGTGTGVVPSGTISLGIPPSETETFPTLSLTSESGIFPSVGPPSGTGAVPSGSVSSGTGVFPTLSVPSGTGIFPSESNLSGTGVEPSGTGVLPTETASIVRPPFTNTMVSSSATATESDTSSGTVTATDSATSTTSSLSPFPTICPGETEAVCDEGICTDLATDPLNCGECGFECPTGVDNYSCVNGVCTRPACDSVCGSIRPCGDPSSTCICTTDADGNGLCLDGTQTCAGKQPCLSTDDCGLGTVCVPQTCCSTFYGVCLSSKTCVGSLSRELGPPIEKAPSIGADRSFGSLRINGDWY